MEVADSNEHVNSSHRRRGQWWRDPLTGVVVGAVISGVAVWIATAEASETTLATQRLQIQADREDKDRQLRASIYQEFADAASNFAFDATLARSTCGGPALRKGEMTTKCDEQWEEAIQSRIRTQAAINRGGHLGNTRCATGSKGCLCESAANPPGEPSW